MKTTASITNKITMLFSFECLLLLAITSGRYKTVTLFRDLPIDITLLLFLLLFIVSIFLFLSKYCLSDLKIYRPTLISSTLFVLFTLYATSTLLWTNSVEYGPYKIMLMWFRVVFPLLCLVFFVIQHEKSLLKFFRITLLFSTIFLFASYYNLAAHGYGLALHFLGPGSYQGIGTVISIGGTISLWFYVTNKITQKQHSGRFYLILTLLYAIILFFVGGKSALITFVISSFPLVLFMDLKKADLLTVIKLVGLGVSILFLITLALWLYYIHTTHLPGTLERISLYFSETLQKTGFERLNLYRWTIGLIASNNPLAFFLGKGIGSWPILVGLGDIFSYPHNAFLEIMFELGFLGLILFASFLIYNINIWCRNLKKTHSHLLVLVAMLFCSRLADALTSGTIAVSYWVILTSAMLTVNVNEMRISKNST